MEERLLEIENNMKVLEDRLYTLERHESSRRIGKLVKSLISIFIVLAVGYGLIKGYSYVTKELPKVIEEKIKAVGGVKV